MGPVGPTRESERGVHYDSLQHVFTRCAAVPHRHWALTVLVGFSNLRREVSRRRERLKFFASCLAGANAAAKPASPGTNAARNAIVLDPLVLFLCPMQRGCTPSPADERCSRRTSSPAASRTAPLAFTASASTHLSATPRAGRFCSRGCRGYNATFAARDRRVLPSADDDLPSMLWARRSTPVTIRPQGEQP